MPNLTWEYRVVREYDEVFGGDILRVCEVYYPVGVDKPMSYAHTSLGSAETLTEIESDIRRIEYALNEPVLDSRVDFLSAKPNITESGEKNEHSIG